MSEIHHFSTCQQISTRKYINKPSGNTLPHNNKTRWSIYHKNVVEKNRKLPNFHENPAYVCTKSKVGSGSIKNNQKTICKTTSNASREVMKFCLKKISTASDICEQFVVVLRPFEYSTRSECRDHGVGVMLIALLAGRFAQSLMMGQNEIL